jgi:hypothetical protein
VLPHIVDGSQAHALLRRFFGFGDIAPAVMDSPG